jgi:hypothetical protein
MKKAFSALVIVFFLLSSQGQVNGALALKVNYKVPLDTESEDSFSFYSYAKVAGSASDRAEKKKFSDLIKTKKIRNDVTNSCKYMDGFNARVKISDARNATSGLGNLKSVSAALRVEAHTQDIPDYSEEELATLEEEYEYYEDYPDYIEEGYTWYSIEADCIFSGTISITSSNAYKIYIDGKSGPEYSRTEFARMKWTVTLVDN